MLPLKLWQMDVTHISDSGKVKYVHMTIDTFSGYLFGNALTREATKYETSHCLHVFLYWMFKMTWSYWPLQSDI